MIVTRRIWARYSIIVLIAQIIFFIFATKIIFTKKSEIQNLAEMEIGEEIEEYICTFHKFDTEDPTIRNLFGKQKPLVCKGIVKRIKNLWTLSENGIIDYNINRKSHFNYSLFDCVLTDKNSNHADGEVLYSGKTFPYKIKGDYALVKCSSLLKKDPNYSSDIFLNPHPTERGSYTKEMEGKYSVLHIMLDGTSALGFMKHLPKTGKMLEEMEFSNFDSLNRVGLNSWPNLIAMLSVNPPIKNQTRMDRKIEKVDTDIGNMPLIFDNFSKNGFSTIFIQDERIKNSGIFNRAEEKPTDYCYATYWVDLLQIGSVGKKHWWQRTFCIDEQPAFDFFLENIELHFKKNAGVLKYLLAFSIVTHDDDSRAEWVDKQIASFFQKSYTSGMFDRTDHGPRLGFRRERTMVGFHEGNRPFLSIYLPPAFKYSYPHLTDNLERNGVNRRLLSAYDIHETLLDLSTFNFHGVQRPKGARGLSLFHDIPKHRSCSSAGIPLQFCSCLQERWATIDTMDYTVIKATATVVTVINGALLKRYPGQCLEFKLQQVIKAEQLTKIKDRFTISNFLKIKLQMKEKDAEFEALLESRNNGTHETSINSIIRTNRYEDKCIDDDLLKTFCICRAVAT